jgi:hypothetical protein
VQPFILRNNFYSLSWKARLNSGGKYQGFIKPGNKLNKMPVSPALLNLLRPQLVQKFNCVFMSFNQSLANTSIWYSTSILCCTFTKFLRPNIFCCRLYLVDLTGEQMQILHSSRRNSYGRIDFFSSFQTYNKFMAHKYSVTDQ